MNQKLKTAATALCALTAFSAAHAADFRAVPGEFVVKFKHGAAGSRAAFTAQGLRIIEELDEQGSWALVKGTSLQQIARLADVATVEPNYIYSLPPVKSQGLEQTWGITKIKAPEAWAKVGRGSSSVIVAIVDTGIDYTHPDLRSHTMKGFNAITGVMDGMDDNSHGTHCAGTIAADGAIFGVAPNVRLLPAKFLSKDGSGDLAAAIKAIEYASSQGAQVMSNSWGGGPYSAALEETISKYCDKGGVFVAAAGNGGFDGVGDNNDMAASYPASYKLKCVISVAATTEADKLTSFSNYGKTVHIGAPGDAIYSTVPGGKYDTYSGTSMATPHVSGTVGLLLSRFPSLTAEQVRSELQAAADPIKFSTWDKLFGKKLGGGRLNVFNLFK